MLALDLQQIVSQVFSFLVLLWILRRFAWRPLLAMLDQRRAHIEEELRQAAHNKAELARLQADYAQRLAKIDEEARAKIQQAILEGKRIGIEVQEQARAQAQAIITKSKETIDLELAKAQVTLRDQLAAMTVEAVEQILKHKLDEKTDHRLIESVLADLEQHAPR